MEGAPISIQLHHLYFIMVIGGLILKNIQKKNLEFFLDYSGFKIIKHEYFDREQAEYSIVGNNIKKRYNIIKNIFKILFKKILFYFFPQMLNHHIIHAKKISDFNDVLKNRPKVTNDKSKWTEFRTKHNLKDL